MAQNPPEGMPRIAPYLLYRDVSQASDWLSRCFGFEEVMRLAGPEGRIAHAEMRHADGVVMLGCPGPDYRGPAASGHCHAYIHVYVADVEAHFARAEAEGVEIESPLEDTFYGDRRYTAVDVEGHRWTFATHIRDVSEAELRG